MKGNTKVIAALNAALAAELTAICQYVIHAGMCGNWGYGRLEKSIMERARGEMTHAHRVIDRILLLGGSPDLAVAPAPVIGKSVKAQIEADYNAELEAVEMYNDAVGTCLAASDHATRELFDGLVSDETDHANVLEGQLWVIGDVGIENWLAAQAGGG
jgi:bacterioferritin